MKRLAKLKYEYNISTLQERKGVSVIFARLTILDTRNVHFEIYHVSKSKNSKPTKKEVMKSKV